MIKRYFSILMAAVFILSGISVFATDENETINNELSLECELLYSIGITSQETHTEKSISRGEFAKWIAAMLGMNTSSGKEEIKFTDVTDENEYYNSVMTVYSLGIMNGISETEFGVKKDISVTDATVSIVRMLGYDVGAKREGGYPDGYIKYAGKLGITKGIGKANKNERLEIVKMCYNALFVPYLDFYGEKVSGASLLEDVHRVYEGEGVITSNMYTSLDDTETDVPYGFMKIGNTLYKTENTDYADMIGKNVDFFYQKGEDNILLCMQQSSSKNRFITILAEDIMGTENNTITFSENGKNAKKANLKVGFTYIENGRTVNERTIKDLEIQDGELTLIDNDSDGIYDVAKAKKIETMAFLGADDTEEILYCKEGNIYTDPFDEDYFSRYYIVNEEDKTYKRADLDEIPTGSILTVYRSRDNKYLEIYAYSGGIYGILEQIGEEEIVIDEKEYPLPLRTPLSELTAGAEVSFSEDMFGRPVYLEDEINPREPKYGYLFALTKQRGLKQGEIKIILGDTNVVYKLAKKINVNDSEEYTGETIINCSKLYDGAVKRQLIRYRLNSKNEVKDIYTEGGNSEYSITKTSDINKNTETKYYQWHRIYEGKYILPQENFFLVIPTVEDEPDDEELYSTKFTLGEDVHNCYVEVYDVNEDMEAGAILMYAQGALKGAATTSASDMVGIITKVARSSENHVVNIWRNGEIKQYKVDDQNVPVIENYAFGDVVRFVIGKNDIITTLEKVLDVGTTGENTPQPLYYQDGYDYHYFARVLNKLDSHYVLVPNYNNPTFNDSVENRIVAPASFGQCAVIDMSQKKIVTGSYSSMAKYFSSGDNGACYAYVRLYKWNTAKELFIYKF